MRTRRTVINTIYAVLFSIVSMTLGLATRNLLVNTFGGLIAGYAGTIEALYNFFSIAEFGIGGVISYRLYETIGAKDVERTCKYMALYKWAYRVVAGIIFLISVAGIFFLPLLIVDPATNWRDVYTLYLLISISNLSGYFLATRRLMYTCTQQGYVCTKIDIVFDTATSFAKIGIALFCPHYVLWYTVPIVLGITANLIVGWRYKRDFPEMHEVKVCYRDFKELNLFHDMRYFLVHRISNTIYGASDTFVTTRMRGAATTTQLGNYSQISSKVTQVGNKIMDAFAAAIGNIVYDKNAAADNHARSIFRSMDLFSYAVGSFVATAYFCLLQPFMRIWMGENALLPMAFVFFFSINEYIGWNHRMICSYRSVLGRFEEDQWYMIASGISNLVLSFAIIGPCGLAGIVAVSVLAQCLMWFGRARVVFRHYMPGDGMRYIGVQVVHIFTMLAALALTSWLCGLLGGGLVNFIGKLLIVLVVPNAVNLAIYGWTPDAEYLRGYARKLLAKLHRKGK